MQELTIIEGQTGQVTANPVDASGNPGAVNDNNFIWTTDNAAVAVLLTANGKVINLRGGTPGTANVQASGVSGASPFAGPSFLLTVNPPAGAPQPAVGFTYSFGVFT